MAYEPRRMWYRDDNHMAVAAYHLVHNALIAPRQRIQEAVAALPVVRKDELVEAGADLEEPCPICLVPLEVVFKEDEARVEKQRAAAAAVEGEADEGEEDGDGEAEEKERDEVLTGVTKLVGCGHIFCRRDLTQWIRSHHGNCPTCRHTFMDLRPVEADDDDSSDGGEYVPDNDFDDDEDDGFLDIDVDAYTDADTEGEGDADDFPVEAMELDVDAFYEEDEDGFAERDEEMGDALDEFADGAGDEVDEDVDLADEWGLTDGESESMSSSDEGLGLGMGMGMPGGLRLAGEEAPIVPDREVSVSTQEDDELDAEAGLVLSVGADGALANVQDQEKRSEA